MFGPSCLCAYITLDTPLTRLVVLLTNKTVRRTPTICPHLYSDIPWCCVDCKILCCAISLLVKPSHSALTYGMWNQWKLATWLLIYRCETSNTYTGQCFSFIAKNSHSEYKINHPQSFCVSLQSIRQWHQPNFRYILFAHSDIWWSVVDFIWTNCMFVICTVLCLHCHLVVELIAPPSGDYFQIADFIAWDHRLLEAFYLFIFTYLFFSSIMLENFRGVD